MGNEQLRLNEYYSNKKTGCTGVATLAKGSGERYGKITVLVVMPGIIFRTTRQLAVYTAGAKMALRALVMNNNIYVLPLLCGMVKILF